MHHSSDVSTLSGIRPVDEFSVYTCRIPHLETYENLSLYDDEVPDLLSKMAKRTAVQMKDGTFAGNSPVPATTSFLDLTAVYYSYTIHRDAVFCILKTHLSCLMKQ